MAEWNRSIEEDERAMETLKAPTKRSAAVNVSSKRYSVSEVLMVSKVDEDDLVDVIAAYKDGTIEKVIGLSVGSAPETDAPVAQGARAKRLRKVQQLVLSSWNSFSC